MVAATRFKPEQSECDCEICREVKAMLAEDNLPPEEDVPDSVLCFCGGLLLAWLEGGVLRGGLLLDRLEGGAWLEGGVPGGQLDGSEQLLAGTWQGEEALLAV